MWSVFTRWIRTPLQRWWPKGRLFRGLLVLGGSTLLIQLVSIGLAPIYSRLYTPHDYGIFGQFYSIVSALLTVGCFCFELAIPTAREEEDALALAVLSLVCVGLISTASLGWAVWEIWRSTGAPGTRTVWFFLLVPVGVLLSGLYRITHYWSIRQRAIKAIAGTAIKQMIGAQAVNLGWAVMHPDPYGLIVSQIINWSAGAGSLARAAKLSQALRTHRRSVFRWHRLWKAARSYRQYALTQCPSTFLNSLGFYLPGVLVLPYFGSDFAGQFNLAQRIGRIPIGLVGSSMSQVFFSEAASIGRTNPARLQSLFTAVSGKLALCALLVLLACGFAPWVVPVAFGQRWQIAGLLTLLLGFGLASQLAVSPLSNIPNVVGRLKGQLILDGIRAALVFAALYVPHHFGLGGKVAIGCYSAVLLANYIACYCLYRYQLRSHAGQISPRTLEPEGVAV